MREGEFDATLRDRTSDSADVEEVTIPTDEVPPGDQGLIAPGAVFYWVVGYRDSLGGGRKRESEIRMRRLPYTAKQIADAARAAEQIIQKLGLAESTASPSAQSSVK